MLFGACGPDPATEAIARGDAAFEQLQFAQAARDYSTAIQLDSTLAHAFLMRGKVRWMSQQYGPAVEDLDRALGLDSTLAWGYFFRGSSYFSLDSLGLALDDLETAAASDELPAEDRARAHRMRAIVYMATERYSEGVDALERGDRSSGRTSPSTSSSAASSTPPPTGPPKLLRTSNGSSRQTRPRPRTQHLLG